MSAGRPGADAGILTVDLGALVANWRRLAAMAPGAHCGAVVKSDGYGLGLEPVVRALARAGCRHVFIARVEEGQRARAAAPDAEVYVLDGLPPARIGDILADGLRPVLSSPQQVALWREAGGGRPAALHVDTGMNRLGLSAAEAQAVAAERPVTVTLLMSHFVSSEEPGRALNALQMERFEAARALVPGVPGSLANSSGVFLGARAHHDLLRPGYALYGGNPTPGLPNPMASVVRLEVPVLQIREITPGESCGYNAQWTASRPSRLATVAYGYGDGYPRAASSGPAGHGADVMVAGRRCPVAGRVSMDLTVIDITDLPAGAVAVGDKVALLDDAIGIDELGSRTGSIGYEILTRLGRRAERRYVGS
jgi:alanine racemase